MPASDYYHCPDCGQHADFCACDRHRQQVVAEARRRGLDPDQFESLDSLDYYMQSTAGDPPTEGR